MKNIEWNDILLKLDQPHLLQTQQWAEVKAAFGWQPIYIYWENIDGSYKMEFYSGSCVVENEPAAAALVLERTLGFGLKVMYVPKGPLLKDWSDRELRTQVLDDLESLAQQHRVIHLKIDPDVSLGEGVPGEDESTNTELGIIISQELESRGWQFSADQIQYRNSVLVDLKPDPDDMLARMKSKTRYNIRLSARKGVETRLGSAADYSLLYEMYAQTAVRGEFTIRPERYYRTVWETFSADRASGNKDPVAQPIIAGVDGSPVAGAVIFQFGDQAWYIHGMSNLDHSEKMPAYQIQWEAMLWAKKQGCRVYDMWGAPDQFTKEDPMWGVYRFKRGFGGKVSRTLGAWDIPIRPVLYRLYINLLPRLLDITRFIQNWRTKQESQVE
jgi:lipid II:glycine glycyltransferase (peptidoglycan interpeptide bridge formation enzyme)